MTKESILQWLRMRLITFVSRNKLYSNEGEQDNGAIMEQYV